MHFVCGLCDSNATPTVQLREYVVTYPDRNIPSPTEIHMLTQTADIEWVYAEER